MWLRNNEFQYLDVFNNNKFKPFIFCSSEIKWSASILSYNEQKHITPNNCCHDNLTGNHGHQKIINKSIT